MMSPKSVSVSARFSSNPIVITMASMVGKFFIHRAYPIKKLLLLIIGGLFFSSHQPPPYQLLYGSPYQFLYGSWEVYKAIDVAEVAYFIRDTPEEVAENSRSDTGRFLRGYLKLGSKR